MFVHECAYGVFSCEKQGELISNAQITFKKSNEVLIFKAHISQEDADFFMEYLPGFRFVRHDNIDVERVRR